jgi:hypothetical protein
MATFPLLALPEGLAAMVVSKLRAADSSTIRKLASTNHAMLQAVLEACSCLKHFEVATPQRGNTAVRCFSRLVFSAAGTQPSRACIQGSLMPGDVSARWTVYMPLCTMARVCADHCSRSPQSATHCAIPATAVATITRVEHVRGSAALPEGMSSLETINLSDADYYDHAVEPGWLPTSSAATVRVLSARCTSLTSVPSGMQVLDELDVSHCYHLTDDWLPASSRACMRTLDASGSSVRQLPEHMGTLQVLRLGQCQLAHDWLPASSAARLQSLYVGNATSTCLPAGMLALKRLDVRNCRNLASNWLPLDSAHSVRELDVSDSTVRCLPEGTSGGSGSRILHCLKVCLTLLQRLPGGVCALEELDVSWCGRLAEDWLPACTAAHVRILRACDTNLTRLPTGLLALTELDCRRNPLLQADFDRRS